MLDDVMMTWFASYANPSDVTLGMHDACIHAWGTCSMLNSMIKYLSGLACMQANLNLERITASHSWVLITQNANENMPNMIPIAYLNENLMDCNENFARDKQEPLTHPHPHMFWYETKGEKEGENFILHSFHVITITFESFHMVFSSEYQHTSTVEHC